jgi:hypothetical protein
MSSVYYCSKRTMYLVRWFLSLPLVRQTLETVDFSANGITATGLKALSQVLPTNTYLKTLNLSGNNIGDEGAKELAPILEKNKGITKLQLNSVNLGDEVIWHIQ